MLVAQVSHPFNCLSNGFFGKQINFTLKNTKNVKEYGIKNNKINVKLELELKLHVKWPFLRNVGLPFLRNAFYGLNVRSTVLRSLIADPSASVLSSYWSWGDHLELCRFLKSSPSVRFLFSFKLRCLGFSLRKKRKKKEISSIFELSRSASQMFIL